MKLDEEQFLRKNLNVPSSDFALKFASKFGNRISFLAQQLKGLQKAKQKFPTWFDSFGLIYPSTLNIEQCSSELTAKYKASLVQAKKIADLTGGFGVDSWAFSKNAEVVYHIDQNIDLQKMAVANLKIIAPNISSFCADGITWLSNFNEPLDLVYLDPSRRVAGKKVYSLAEYEPNVLDNLELLKSKCQQVLIKASPMFDIKAGINELQNVIEVHVLSVNNECKELLFLLDFNQAVDEPKIICVNLNSIHANWTFNYSSEKAAIINYTEPQKYIYEANASVQKAGAFKSLAALFQLDGLHPNTRLLTANAIRTNFPGKIYEVLKTDMPSKANVVSRNHPLSAEQLAKKYKIKKGGEDFILAFTSREKKHIVPAKRVF